MKRNLLTIVISAVLAVLFILLLFVFQVRKSEIAVVTRFGATNREKPEPGAYFRWPWPIENVYKLDQRIQNFEDKITEPLTADNNILLINVYVGWRITDAKAFFPRFAGGSIAVAEHSLEDIVSQAKSAAVGKHPLSDFVNADEKQLKFDAIEAEIKALASAQLATNNAGVKIEYLGIKRLGLPESVTQTVFERMTKDRERLANKFQNEGEAEAQKIRSEADRKAAEVISAAEGEARRIRGQGEAVAAEALRTFQQNPELATFLLSLEALEISLKEKATLIFDERTPPFNLFSGSFTNKFAK
jgi:modulator of FtsH protease HflC